MYDRDYGRRDRLRRRPNRSARSRRSNAFPPHLDASVLPFNEAAAEIYGALRADLERIGKRLDDPDLRIASIALSRDLTLVTGNVRYFSRVPGLRIENWLEPD